MSVPYLIAHLVRGQPALDIAIRCIEEDGWGTYTDSAPWWLIPTSGHRAYPYWWVNINEIPDLQLLFKSATYDPRYKWPEGHLDHYALSNARDAARLDTWEAKQTVGPELASLAERLGLLRRLQIRRR